MPESTGRVLGLLGGMGWPSTLEAYRQLNTHVHDQLGGVHSADLVIRSLDFAEVEALQASGDWDGAGHLLGVAAAGLRAAGANAVMLCTNTMHQVAADIERICALPLLHIADATAAAVVAAGVQRVGLLGTAYTMEGDFYAGRLGAHGLDVVVPPQEDRRTVHEIIYTELVMGEVCEDSRARYLAVIERLVAAGARGIIAGCTEIELLVGADDIEVPWFPTTQLHVAAAGDWLLGRDYPPKPSTTA